MMPATATIQTLGDRRRLSQAIRLSAVDQFRNIVIRSRIGVARRLRSNEMLVFCRNDAPSGGKFFDRTARLGRRLTRFHLISTAITADAGA